jgi:hypothetical protein
VLARSGWPDRRRAFILADVSGAPGPDGGHDDLDADALEGLALFVPDDARSLDADRLRYVEELRARAREGQPSAARRPPPRLGRFGLSGSVVVVVLVVVGLVGSLLSVFAPRLGREPAFPVPLAAAPTAQPGELGGLLPDVTVGVGGRELPLREFRPGLIALVPAACTDCGPVLQSLLLQGREYGLRLVLAGPAPAAELTELDRTALGGAATVVDDPTGSLVEAFDPVGVTAVLVAVDGVVGAVVPEVTADQRLEPALAQLGRTGSTTSA